MEPLHNGGKLNGKTKEIDVDRIPIEVIDNLEINDSFKKSVLEPYLEKVYETIIGRTHTQFKGIPSYEFTEVILNQ